MANTTANTTTTSSLLPVLTRQPPPSIVALEIDVDVAFGSPGAGARHIRRTGILVLSPVGRSAAKILAACYQRRRNWLLVGLLSL